jgi:asparagine synthase (glutamine-hydrolysing)
MKVVLSGLGGDEVFGGYQSFGLVPRLIRTSRLLNPVWPLRKGAGKILEASPSSPRSNRLGKFLQEAPTTSAAYWGMRGIFTPHEVALLLPRYGMSDANGDSQLQFYVPAQPTLEDEVSYLELTRYMRNQLLRDSDVMSMAWGLELRVPFVDGKLVSAVARIPAELRLAEGKQILLNAVPELPTWVTQRPKQGFVFPFGDWIHDEWHDIFERIESRSPVKLKNWYRRWCIFALESFLERNEMRGTRLAVAA